MRLRALILATTILAAGQAAADIDRGLQAYEAGDYETALAEWAVDAQAGDPLGQYLLGHLHESGLAVAEDPLEAYRWYALAAAQGYEDAEAALTRVAEGLSEDQLTALQGAAEADEASEAAPASPEEALLQAVLDDDAGRAAELLAAGGDPNLRFSDGDPILLEAARQGFAGLVLTLIGAGAEIDAAGDDGWTPLMAAVDAGHEPLATILLRQGADAFASAEDGTTAHGLAAERELTGLLALAGTPPRAAPPSPERLIEAAGAGDRTGVAELIEAGAAVDGADSDGWTALMFAAFGGHDAVARQLLAAGAGVNAKAHDGSTALMAATLGRQAGMVRLLLKSGAKASRRTQSGGSALQIAEQNGFGEIAGLLRARLGPPPALVSESQSLLARLGYAPGPVDGAMGPMTRAAVKAFQRDRGIAADGRVSAELLAALQAADARRVGERAAADAWAGLGEDASPGDLLAFAAEFPESPLAERARRRASQMAVQVMIRKDAAAAPRQTSQPAAQTTTAPRRDRPRRAAARSDAAVVQVAHSGPLAAPTAGPSAQERTDWATVMGRGRAADFAAYLEIYPDGAFAAQARYLLQQQSLVPSPAPAAVDLGPVTRYLAQRPQHFHGQVNAYNKRNRVVASGTQITYKVREIYEAVAFGAEDGAFKVNVLMGVGNWQDAQNNAGLNVERVVLYLAPAGNAFRIVGHSTDPAALPARG